MNPVEESKSLLEAARKMAGIDYKKVQIASVNFLEIAKKNNLNSSEFKEAIRLSQNALDYSLTRLSANHWFSIAAEKAKE